MIGKKLEAPITLELYYHNQKNMLVERTFSVVENPTGDRGVCTSCPINIVCFKFVDRQTGDVHTQDVEYYSSRSGDYLSSNFVRRTSKQASICRKSFPNYKIKETTPKEIHRIVGRSGNTIVESESWFTNINSTDQQKLRDKVTEEGEKKALESGILDKADKNAENIIRNMIKSNKSTKDYEVEFEYK